MDTVFRLPDLGEGLRDAEIVAWHVGVGDHVVADQPLVSVETDKAVVEVPSPRGGRIAALHGVAGDRVTVGAPLVDFAAAPAADAGAIVGEVPAQVPAGWASAPTPAPGLGARVRASPAVRRRAAELGVDLATVSGTGPDGVVTLADLDAAAAGGAGGTAPFGDAVVEPLRGVRRAMHLNMTRAGREVVRATVTGEADVDAWPAGTDATLRLVRAIVHAAAVVPALNATFDAASETRTLHRRVDVAVAVDLGDGLYTPVLRDAGGRDADALRRDLDALKAAVAQRTIARDAMTGATITLSNFGAAGGRFAELVVMPPQVAIVGAGRIAPRVVVVDGAPAVRQVLPLSLSFDHRVVTGVEATRFLQAAIDDLRQP